MRSTGWTGRHRHRGPTPDDERAEMPRQNRVTPMGELIATPARGLVYGNRGCLHDDEGRIRRRYAVKRWIACRLRFKGWHREPLMQPGRFTELFFLDEDTRDGGGPPTVRALPPRGLRPVRRVVAPPPRRAGRRRCDRCPAACGTTRSRYTHPAAPSRGVLRSSRRRLRSGRWHGLVGARDRLLRWSPGGYDLASRRPVGGPAEVITPSLVASLAIGWMPRSRCSIRP